MSNYNNNISNDSLKSSRRRGNGAVFGKPPLGTLEREIGNSDISGDDNIICNNSNNIIYSDKSSNNTSTDTKDFLSSSLRSRSHILESISVIATLSLMMNASSLDLWIVNVSELLVFTCFFYVGQVVG